MKKFLTAIFASVILIGCSPFVNAEYRKPVNVTYSVQTKDGNNYCSAVKIGPELFLSAAHCFERLDRVPYLQSLTGEQAQATVIKTDKVNDLVLLTAPLSGPNARILGIVPVIGDDVLIVGYPLGVGPVLTRGIYSAAIFQSDDVMSEIKSRLSIVTAPCGSRQFGRPGVHQVPGGVGSGRCGPCGPPRRPFWPDGQSSSPGYQL